MQSVQPTVMGAARDGTRPGGRAGSDCTDQGACARFIRSGSRRKERCRAAACDFHRSAVWGYAAALQDSICRHSSRERAAAYRPPAADLSARQRVVSINNITALQASARRHSSRIRAAACRPPAAPQTPPARQRAVSINNITALQASARRRSLRIRGRHVIFTAVRFGDTQPR